MTAYVHIGIGKTGTTSIQGYLAGHRVPLLKRGFLYPSAGLLGNAHYGFFELQSSKVTSASFDLLAQEIAEHPSANIVISSENLSFAPEAVIERFLQVLGGDTQILFYVRRQEELISSVFLQWVKDGWDYQGSVDRFFNDHWASFNFVNLIAPWAKHFGRENIVAHVYDARVIGQNATNHFLGLLGQSDLKAKNDRLNPSLLPEFFATVKSLDDIGIDGATRKEVVASLLEASIRLKKSSSLNLISQETRRRIVEMYAESNQEFAERYLPKSEREFLLG